jgi:hypothetical protein
MSWLERRDRKTEHGYSKERLSAYLDGELLPREREAVEQHLAGCSSCRWEVETLRQTVQWASEMPVVPIPRVFTIPAQAAPARARRRWRFMPALQGATALVAALLFVAMAGEAMLTGSLPLVAPAPGSSQEAARVVETVVLEAEAAKMAPEVPEGMMSGAEAPAGEAEEAPMAQQLPESEVAVTQEMEPMMAVAPETAVEEQANLQSTPGIGGAMEGEAATAADVHEDAAVSPTPVLQGTQMPAEPPMPAASTTETETQRAMVAPTTTPLPSLAAPGTAVAAPGTAVAAPGTAVAASAPAEGEPALIEAPPPAAGGGLLSADEGQRQAPGWLRVVEYVLGVALILLTGTTIGLMVWRRQVG